MRLLGYAESPIRRAAAPAHLHACSIPSRAASTRCARSTCCSARRSPARPRGPCAQAGVPRRPGGVARADGVAPGRRPGHTRSTLQLGEPSVIAERLGVTDGRRFPAARHRRRRAGRAAGIVGRRAAVRRPAAEPRGAEHRRHRQRDLGAAGRPVGGHAGVRYRPGQRADRPRRLAAQRRHAALRRRRRAGRGRPRATTRCWPSCSTTPTFALQPPKSTGRELFGAQLVDPFIDRCLERGLSTADMLATLTAFTAHSIADQYRRFLPGPARRSGGRRRRLAQSGADAAAVGAARPGPDSPARGVRPAVARPRGDLLRADGPRSVARPAEYRSRAAPAPATRWSWAKSCPGRTTAR